MKPTHQTHMAPELVEELQEDFRESDTDGDGYIDFAEFGVLMENIGAGMSGTELRTGFGEIDADHDGRISLAEFLEWRSVG